MILTRDKAQGPPMRRRCANVLRRASLALCLSFVLASPAIADVVELKNGALIKCKVVKEMQDLIKVRMPHRGKIVTTFLNKGSVKSISKSSDVENRQFFQGGGIHNPGRGYEPVYYSGSASGVSGAKGPGAARQLSAKGKAKGETGGRKRGLDARRERSDARAKERSARFGDKASKGSKGSTTGIGSTTGSGGSSSSSSAASPSTSSSSSSTMSIGQ